MQTFNCCLKELLWDPQPLSASAFSTECSSKSNSLSDKPENELSAYAQLSGGNDEDTGVRNKYVSLSCPENGVLNCIKMLGCLRSSVYSQWSKNYVFLELL